jgi:DNA-binding SARP family transcriptional activator
VLTFKILGSLEVVRDGESLPLGAAKQRALVACLLLHPNDAVSTDRLMDDLWGQEAPSTAEHMLHVYVSRLRKVLEVDGKKVLVTRAPGYLIQLGADDVLDATLFEAMVRQARGTDRRDPARSLELLERGLALWRGAALADFAYEPFAQAAVGRLEELRVVAEEERVESLLALGRHQEAIPELESLVQRYPLREHLRAQQMLALYRAGRQSEALTALQAARQTLAAELGIDPGPELRSLEEAILRHDPDLQAPVVPSTPAPVAGTPEQVPPKPAPGSGDRKHPKRRARGFRRLVPVLAVSLLALGILVAVVALRDEEAIDPPTRTGVSEPDSSELLLTWQEAGSDTFTGVGDQKILGAVETSAGYLVFGYTTTTSTSVGAKPDFDVAVWRGTPDDGWTAVPSALFVASGNQRATDGVALEDGTIVLVGSDQSQGDFDGAVWKLSSDPSTWSRARPGSEGLREERDQFTRDVTAVGPDLVAVGSTQAADGVDVAVWRSQRGRKWVFIKGAAPAEGDQEMATVVRSADRVVAAGFSEVDGDRDAAIWTSRDGVSWRRAGSDADLGGLGDQQINSLAVVGSRFIAVGQETIGDDTNAVVWTSADGRDWTRVPDPTGGFDGPGDQIMYTVLPTPVGIVAAGSEVLEPEWDAAVWTSVDGVSWERLSGDTPAMSALTDIGNQEIKALMWTGSGFLALGSERGGVDWDAQAWIGEPIP